MKFWLEYFGGWAAFAVMCGFVSFLMRELNYALAIFMLLPVFLFSVWSWRITKKNKKTEENNPLWQRFTLLLVTLSGELCVAFAFALISVKEWR